MRGKFFSVGTSLADRFVAGLKVLVRLSSRRLVAASASPERLRDHGLDAPSWSASVVPRSPSMTRIGVLLLVVLSLPLAGCGDSEEPSAGGGGGQVAGCLTPGEVTAEVNVLAEGIEGTTEEVEQKQAAIAVVEAEAC